MAADSKSAEQIRRRAGSGHGHLPGPGLPCAKAAWARAFAITQSRKAGRRGGDDASFGPVSNSVRHLDPFHKIGRGRPGLKDIEVPGYRENASHLDEGSPHPSIPHTSVTASPNIDCEAQHFKHYEDDLPMALTVQAWSRA